MWCPLKFAVYNSHERVVEVLLDRGLEALGGSSVALPPAILNAVLNARTRILHMLLLAEGEDRRAFWANHTSGGIGPNLFRATSMSLLAVVGVLMAHGADENTRDLDGRDARDYIGLRSDDHEALDPKVANAAIRRMLERGPAFRARSWAYPAFLADPRCAPVDACRRDDGAGARDDLPAGGARTSAIRVRIYRSKDRNMFATLLGREQRCAEKRLLICLSYVFGRCVTPDGWTAAARKIRGGFADRWSVVAVAVSLLLFSASTPM